MTCLGDQLVTLLQRARREVTIVAPFIRTSALTRLLDAIQPPVRSSIYTRWRPLDIVAGASDLEVFELVQEKDVPLLLQHDLHAKAFVIDDSCMVGSANVTETALGWRKPSNLELLIPMDNSPSEVEILLDELRSTATLATRHHYEHMKALVEELTARSDLVMPTVVDLMTATNTVPPTWLPKTMNPEDLYSVYMQGQEADVSRSTLSGMVVELCILGVPPAMSKPEFISWIGESIRQTPVVTGVLNHIESHGSVNEHSIGSILTDAGIDPSSLSASDTLRTLQRWLTYFLSDRYETTAETVKLIRASPIDGNPT